MPVFQLSHHLVFPPAGLARGDGLLAVGGDLSEDRILLAYQMGIFPWYSEGDPILWWAPDPRLILRLEDFHISKRLGREIRKNTFHITFDHCFDKVIEACSTIRPETWIVPEMIEAYCRLHEQGYAHSVECWLDDKLAGGLYGVSLGGVFFGESMFSRVSNSSKIALAALIERLKGWNFDFIDCQMKTNHLVKMGAREIPGAVFYEWLSAGTRRPTRLGNWSDTADHEKK